MRDLKPAAQAQHSPLSKDERQSQNDGRTNFTSDWPYRDLKRKYEQSRAHAQRLADAVRDLLGVASHHHQRYNAREALAEWSKQK